MNSVSFVGIHKPLHQQLMVHVRTLRLTLIKEAVFHSFTLAFIKVNPTDPPLCGARRGFEQMLKA